MLSYPRSHFRWISMFFICSGLSSSLSRTEIYFGNIIVLLSKFASHRFRSLHLFSTSLSFCLFTVWNLICIFAYLTFYLSNSICLSLFASVKLIPWFSSLLLSVYYFGFLSNLSLAYFQMKDICLCLTYLQELLNGHCTCVWKSATFLYGLNNFPNSNILNDAVVSQRSSCPLYKNPID